MKLSSITPSRALFGLCLSFSLIAQTASTSQQAPEQAPRQQTPPPEQDEYKAALRIADFPERIKELKRIKAAYPDSSVSYGIDYNLLDSVSKSADDFGTLLTAQKDVIAASKQRDRFLMIANAVSMMINHRKIAEFPKPDVLKAVQDYRAEAMPLLDDPEIFSRYTGELRETALNTSRTMLELPLTKALLMNGKGQESLNVLETYRKTAPPSANYYIALGETYQELKRDKDALDAFFEAAVAGNGSALAAARALYAKINNSANFDNELELRKARHPFQPPPFKAPEKWGGKTVLAEVFTGSECGPCVAASFAFDALEESYPTKYLAVLKYHLPVPNYDPMMNPATKKRQDYYGRDIIKGTPTAIIDGVISPGVGGDRLASSASFGTAKKEIDTAMAATADITVKASASITGDNVKVDCVFSKVIEGADYNVVLVQTKEDFKGGNGIVRHNMVVRDIKTVAPSDKASVTFNIVESEKAADAHIAEWGNRASERSKQLSKWPAKHNKIDRANLKAVVFVQNKDTRQIYNAFVADVTAKR
ncbi:MAG: hypothetical protein LBH03_01525 [Holophagales bacterium]|nr:hypothetical protein [Holophagales bacterium]